MILMNILFKDPNIHYGKSSTPPHLLSEIDSSINGSVFA